jgi:hypothetical protein
MCRRLYVVCLAVTASLLTGCGSTSSLRSETGERLVCNKQFDRVQVARFHRLVKKSDTADTKVDWACGHFADLIVRELTATGAFATVSRVEDTGIAYGDVLVISGDITRYVEGNAFARFMVGFGAGSSYFDAAVRFADGGTGDKIGTIKVARNSWVLGGGYASGQTPEMYMAEAAKKIASEAKRLARVQESRS